MRADVLVAEVMMGAPGEPAGITELDGEDAGPSPVALVAVTVQVYVLPLVRPVTVMGELVPVIEPVVPPLVEVQTAVVAVMALPPLLVGAVYETAMAVLAPMALTRVGEPGTLAGTTADEGAEAEPVPITLVAVKVQV